jgi:hypothetical protein
MGVVWIASYPKSGNTWLRFLLANYLKGPIDESARVEALIPDVMRRRNLSELIGSHPVVYGKTHHRWARSHPHAAETIKAVVVIRHPKDVMLSHLNYHRLDRRTEKGFTDAAYIRIFIREGGDPAWAGEGWGTLEENVRSWTEATDIEHLLVQYEELKADARGVMARLVEFLGLPFDSARLDMAVANSTFEQMRAIEVREKAAKKFGQVFAGAPPRPGWARYFMNEGKVRGTLKHIDPGLDSAFDARFGSFMASMGYAPSI